MLVCPCKAAKLLKAGNPGVPLQGWKCWCAPARLEMLVYPCKPRCKAKPLQDPRWGIVFMPTQRSVDSPLRRDVSEFDSIFVNDLTVPMPMKTTTVPALRIRALSVPDNVASVPDNVVPENGETASGSSRGYSGFSISTVYGHTSGVQSHGDYVLYWMTAYRRVGWNFALQRARDWAVELGRPLLILEGLRCDYEWASERFHRFVIQGMVDNQRALAETNAYYYPYVEPIKGAGKGLVRQLAMRACVVVSDDFPCFFHPGMYQRLAQHLPCRFELVDSNGLMPLAAADRTFTVAHSYRRWMQKELPKHLPDFPEAAPLSGNGGGQIKKLASLPRELLKRWPEARLDHLLQPGGLNNLPIDHSLLPVGVAGGTVAAQQQLRRFIQRKLLQYDHDRNEPDLNGSTELSSHLHFGHISAHQLFESIMQSESWDDSKLGKPNGKMNGFWGVQASAEALLDQLCTWREIGFNMCWREPNFDQYASLPGWAQQTLAEHASDRRPWVYTLEEFESAKTHDPIWNAAQRQLVIEGRIHNYMRMLWGKKILHWAPSPQDALSWMIHLNNKYALDGRDPNSYSGIFWVLGRYDRAWGPEREVFGKIRYMTSENTAKKHQLGQYLLRYNQFPT